MWLTFAAAPCTTVWKPVIGLDALNHTTVTTIDSTSTATSTTPHDLAPAALSNVFADDSYWWRHEQLHRLILTDYRHNMQLIRPARDLLQDLLLEQATSFCKHLWRQQPAATAGDTDHRELAVSYHATTREQRCQFVERCMRQVQEAESKWHACLVANQRSRWVQSLLSWAYMLEWRFWINRRARIPLAANPPVATIPAMLACALPMFVIPLVVLRAFARRP
jgi:hypothetical protein